MFGDNNHGFNKLVMIMDLVISVFIYASHVAPSIISVIYSMLNISELFQFSFYFISFRKV